jgi:hypothetical protein
MTGRVRLWEFAHQRGQSQGEPKSVHDSAIEEGSCFPRQHPAAFRITISLPESSPHLLQGCCEDKDVHVTLRDREVRTEDIWMPGLPPPDG